MALVKITRMRPRQKWTDVLVKVGPWACRYKLDRKGWFSNGSKHSSGWSNWKKESTYV